MLNKPPPFAVDIHHDYATLDKVTNDPSFIKHDLTFDVDTFKDRLEKCRPTGTMKRLEKKLEDIYLSFKGHGATGKEHLGYLGNLSKQEHHGRPITPEVVVSEDKEEEMRKPHIVLLQKIARGRALQKLIRDEMNTNMTEILGLKRMYDMDPNCKRMEESQLQKLMAMKKNADAEDTRDTPVEEVVGHLEGETLAKMIDFLDKEMVRLIDERKIHALILLAERERRLKEAAEGGRRFQEEETRRANDEIFKQVAGIHQATVDMYLEDIFLESCDRAADDQSRIYVQKLATTLNDALYSARQALTDYEQEELAADLVSSFMIPELHRLYHNSRIDAAGARFTKASEQVVDAVFSAHPITKQILEELEPVVDDHLMRSTAALDGGAQIVDEIIAEAVCVALSPLAAAEPPQEDTHNDSTHSQQSSSSKTGSSSKTTDTSNKTGSSSGSTKILSSDDSKKQDSGDSPKPTERMISFERPPEQVLTFENIPKKDESKDEEEEEEREEEYDEEEEETEAKEFEGQLDEEETPAKPQEGEELVVVEEETEDILPQLTFRVDDSVVRNLAAKSVQVYYDTEPGQQVDAVYSGATYTVDNLFEEVRRKIVPPKMDDSASDNTLSDDTDD